jgi:drug/metabolite transporter (DMT)-like permease
MKTALYTIFALFAFALNSILCRLALGTGAIDATSFTVVRLLSGAITLSIIFSLFGKRENYVKCGSWISAFFLFTYAVCFSFAYVNLATGTGALILFGTVQVTMIALALRSGERPQVLEWAGFASAFCGLIYLVFPALAAAPPLASSLLMAAAGVSWAAYTLRGRTSENPLADTTGNFVRALPMMIAAALPFIFQTHLSARGILLAVLSGALASGIGYAVWYKALEFHTRTRAAFLQLSVPALAGIGGVIFLAENVSLRLLTATVLILGGIGLAISGKRKL